MEGNEADNDEEEYIVDTAYVGTTEPSATPPQAPSELESLRALVKAQRLQMEQQALEMAALKQQAHAQAKELAKSRQDESVSRTGTLQTRLSDRGLQFVCRIDLGNSSSSRGGKQLQFRPCSETEALLGGLNGASRGAHGTTYGVRECGGFGGGMVMALKLVIISGRSPEEKEAIKREKDVLVSVSTRSSSASRHIIKYLSGFPLTTGTPGLSTREYFCLAMEYAANGSLEERILQPAPNKYRFDEARVLKWLAEIVDALACLHGGDEGKFQSFSHSDIHSGNLLLNQEDSILLADFGLARKLNPMSGGKLSGEPQNNASAYASRTRRVARCKSYFEKC